MNTPEKRPTNCMWTPPKGWFKAATEGRDERSTRQFKIEDNQRRKDRGLPTYEV